MKRTEQIIANVVFALQVLLLFLLLFEGWLELPRPLQPVGRMHPLLLHLPIGLLILVGLFPLLKKEVDARALNQVQSFVLHLAALTAAVTALTGLFLAQEDAYNATLVGQHKWLGSGVSFLTYGLMVLSNRYPQRQQLFNGALFLNIALMIAAGHLGAAITHGEDFVLAPLRKAGSGVTEETPVFTAAVHPILESRCFNCHNERKSKGGLIMTTPEQLLKGGENGPVWTAGNAGESHIILRLQLPPDNEEHMPPEGKPQLNDDEIELIRAWIQAGADMEQKLKDLDPETPLFALVNKAVANRRAEAQIGTHYDFDPAPEKTIEGLNGPFRTVRPLSVNSPALHAEIFVRRFYEPRFLEELKDVKLQLSSLNLTNMPVTDEDLTVIAQFQNLEKLILNGTEVTGKKLETLKNCSKLRSLALANTAVTADIAQALPQLTALEELFVWNTGITTEQLRKIENEFPAITFHGGYVPDYEEMLALPPPRLKNESTLLKKGEKIVLENKFPGAVIRYSTDGSEPDSLESPVFTAPFQVEDISTVKARTFREGWLSSNTAEFLFFPEGLRPDSAILLSPPEPKYAAKGARSLFDGRKGKADNFLGDLWLGFRENHFVALLDMGAQPPAVGKVVMSYLLNIPSYIMPPASMEVWGGDDPANLTLLARIDPGQPGKYESNRVGAVALPIPESTFRYYKVAAAPVGILPEWHQGAGDKGWVFVDELFFY